MGDLQVSPKSQACLGGEVAPALTEPGGFTQAPFLLTLIGTAGLPDDVSAWSSRLSWIDAQAGRLIITAVGVAVIVGVLVGPTIRNSFRPQANLRVGDFSEETREALGGANLQVIRVAIYNARDSGGETTTARDVVPKLEAFSSDGRLVASTRGSWGYDARGQAPPTVTFRPTHEEHPLELVAKFPDGDKAWLAGAEDPELGPGTYTVRASLRGDGLRKPATFSWQVVNPGKGGTLVVVDQWPIQPRRTAEPTGTTASLSTSASEATLTKRDSLAVLLAADLTDGHFLEMRANIIGSRDELASVCEAFADWHNRIGSRLLLGAPEYYSNERPMPWALQSRDGVRDAIREAIAEVSEIVKELRLRERGT